MKKINILEGIDRTFLSCLEEIMHSYSCLDKQGRLRVEQWVQKLASVPLSPPSSNRTVRKHQSYQFSYSVMFAGCLIFRVTSISRGRSTAMHMQSSF